MNRDRLITLRNYLRDHVLEDRFDLGYWFQERSCGTIACAMGWATTIPEFQKAGLKLIQHPGFSTFDIAYKGRNGYHAAAAFMDIPYYDADYLFSPDHYPDGAGKDEVIDRITRYICKVIIKEQRHES